MSLKKIRAYLDTNVFIFGIERPASDSGIILDLAEEGKIVPVTSYFTLNELREYFARTYGREAAINAIYFLISLPNLEIVTRDMLKQEINKYKGIVPDEDLPHLASAIIARVDYLVSYNRHFIESNAKNYVKTIKQADFLEILGIKP